MYIVYICLYSTYVFTSTSFSTNTTCVYTIRAFIPAWVASWSKIVVGIERNLRCLSSYGARAFRVCDVVLTHTRRIASTYICDRKLVRVSDRTGAETIRDMFQHTIPKENSTLIYKSKCELISRLFSYICYFVVYYTDLSTCAVLLSSSKLIK